MKAGLPLSLCVLTLIIGCSKKPGTELPDYFAQGDATAAKIKRELGAFATSCSWLKPPACVYVSFDQEKLPHDLLSRLGDFPTIGALFFRDTDLTDAELERIESMHQLQWLGFEGCHITDAGLKHLTGLTNLQRLGVSRTEVSEAGIEELRKALPNCEISR